MDFKENTDVKVCDKCHTPFVKVDQVQTVIRHRYVFTVMQERGDSNFEVDKFALCVDCSDMLYVWMQEHGFRKAAVDKELEGLHEIIRDNPKLMEIFEKFTNRE